MPKGERKNIAFYGIKIQFSSITSVSLNLQGKSMRNYTYEKASFNRIIYYCHLMIRFLHFRLQLITDP